MDGTLNWEPCGYGWRILNFKGNIHGCTRALNASSNYKASRQRHDFSYGTFNFYSSIGDTYDSDILHTGCWSNRKPVAYQCFITSLTLQPFAGGLAWQLQTDFNEWTTGFFSCEKGNLNMCLVVTQINLFIRRVNSEHSSPQDLWLVCWMICVFVGCICQKEPILMMKCLSNFTSATNGDLCNYVYHCLIQKLFF